MRILTAALISGALILLGLGYLHMIGEPPQPPPLDLRMSYREVMPEQFGELPRVHHRGPNGLDTHVDLTFTNGDTGTLKFGASGVLQEAEYKFADGALRKQMRFAADGKTLVEGFELRRDRTQMWRTESFNRNSFAVTTVYWIGGKQPFSVIEENRQQGTRTSKYFRQDGSIQLSRMESASGILLSEKVFDVAGKLQSELSSKTGETTVDYFAASGKLAFKQVYEAYEYQKDGPNGQAVPAVARVLKKVLVVAEDGDTVMRILTISGGFKPFVQQELKANEDGTRSRFVFDEKGQLVTAKRLGNNNRAIEGFVEPKDAEHQFDPRYTEKPGVVASKVFGAWKEAEAKASFKR